MTFAFAYFRTSSETLHLALSNDGIIWVPLNQNASILKCEIGHKSVRDPYIRRGTDGLFHMIHSEWWTGNSFIHVRSRDLIHWDPAEIVPIMASVPSTRNVWAPEFVFNPVDHLYYVFWSSTTSRSPFGCRKSKWQDHRIWYSTTSDFSSYGTPALLFDPGYSIIDATIVQVQDQWYMVFKDERGKNKPNTKFKALKVARATRITGPWELLSNEFISPHLTEGPTLFKHEGKWWLFFDYFMSEKYGARETTNWYHWNEIGVSIHFPEGARHGTIFEIENAIADGLRKAFMQ